MITLKKLFWDENLSHNASTHVSELKNVVCDKLSCVETLHVNNLGLESLDNNVDSFKNLLDDCVNDYNVETFGHSSPYSVHEPNYLEKVDNEHELEYENASLEQHDFFDFGSCIEASNFRHVINYIF